MATPATRYTVPPAGSRPADTAALDRSGEDWITRKVAANGVISVAWRQISVGKHRAGDIVDVHLDGQLLQIWSGTDLLMTMVRTDTKEVRKKRAERPATT